MQKSCFISGITGQDGAYLAKLLLERGYTVTGGARRISQREMTRLETLGIRRHVNVHHFDLTDPDSILQTIQSRPVDEFYNLAAQSIVGDSWEVPVYTSDVDGMGVLRVLDCLRTRAPETRFFQASTSEVFGSAPEVPQQETTPFRPRSPYGAAKVFGHNITRNYREGFGMHASSGILFNHESPLRGPEFVTRKISLALAKLARGGTESCRLGNLDVKRDWGFAGEFVEGMWRMLQQEKADDYVLATGIVSTVRDFVSHVASALGMSLNWIGEGLSEHAVDRRSGRRVVEVCSRLFRPADGHLLVGNSSKARSVLGWKPVVDVQQLAEMMARGDYDALGRSATTFSEDPLLSSPVA